MDDLRVGSISPHEVYQDTAQSGSKKRKRRQHDEDAAPEDEVRLSAAEPEDGAAAEDTYTPSEPAQE